MIARLLILTLFLSFPLQAAERARKKVGLALSGGGARGISEIGVLRVLEELHVPIDYIAGTSAGAWIGAMYAAGYSVDEIEKIIRETNWDETFREKIDRRDLIYRRKIDHDRYLFDFEMGFKDWKPAFPKGLIYGQKVSLLFQNILLRVADTEDFSKLPIPFKAVATDIESGEKVVLSHGNLAEAIRASSAVPGLFSPVEWEGRWLVDGGTSNNLPVDVVKEMGADVVIAVDISSPLANRKELESFIDVSNQSFTVMTRRTTEEQIAHADVVIVPKLTSTDIFGYSRTDEFLRLGETETRRHAERLQTFAISKTDYEAEKKHRERKIFQPLVVRNLQIDGSRRADLRIVGKNVEMKSGDPFDAKKLKANLQHVYGLGDFERVDYLVSGKDQDADLKIRLKEKDWGPNYLRFAINFDGELEGDNDFNGMMDLTFTRINRLGAEWRNDVLAGSSLQYLTEFVQPLDYSDLFFVALLGQAKRTNESVYADQDRVAIYSKDEFDAEFDAGIQLGKFGELRTGFRQGYLNASVDTGLSIFPTEDAHTGGWVGRFQMDRLDNAYFPTRGFATDFNVLMSREAFGSKDSYNKLEFQSTGFHSISRHIGFFGLYGGSAIGDDLPPYDPFFLGGFLSLSGYRREELRGNHAGLARLGYFYKIPTRQSFFMDGLYLGTWAEAGNAWANASDVGFDDLKYSGTLALGMDTRIGPVYLAYGQSDASHFQFYLSIGRTFMKTFSP